MQNNNMLDNDSVAWVSYPSTHRGGKSVTRFHYNPSVATLTLGIVFLGVPQAELTNRFCED